MAEDFTRLLTDPEVKTIHFSDRALETIKAMARHTEQVKACFGGESKVYLDEVESFVRVVSQILSFGFAKNQHVTRDGELSLLVNGGGVFVFGVVFFRDRKYDNPPEGQVQPGTWSCHS